MGAPAETLLRLCLVVGMGLGLVGIVGGCSDPDQPSTLSTDAPTPTSSSSSPSPSPETVEQEVEAAVRAYYAELTRAARTQQTARVKRLMATGCPCYQVAKAIDATRRSGRTTPDAAWEVQSIQVHDVEPGLAVAEVKYEVSAYRVLNEKNNVVDRYPRQQEHVDLSFVTFDEGWIIGNLVDLES